MPARPPRASRRRLVITYFFQAAHEIQVARLSSSQWEASSGPIVNRAIKFPGDHQPVPTAPPVLGQHTDEILRDILGLTSEQVEVLRECEAVA